MKETRTKKNIWNRACTIVKDGSLLSLIMMDICMLLPQGRRVTALHWDTFISYEKLLHECRLGTTRLITWKWTTPSYKVTTTKNMVDKTYGKKRNYQFLICSAKRLTGPTQTYLSLFNFCSFSNLSPIQTIFNIQTICSDLRFCSAVKNKLEKNYFQERVLRSGRSHCWVTPKNIYN